jgi:hypothetical protein
VSNALAAARDSRTTGEFAMEWVKHVDGCKIDLEGIQRVVAIMISSPARRPIIAKNLDTIRQSVLPIEDEHFPISVPPYRNLVHHLEQMIAYLKTSSDRLRRYRRSEDDDALSIQMNFMSMNSLAASSGFLTADP